MNKLEALEILEGNLNGHDFIAADHAANEEAANHAEVIDALEAFDVDTSDLPTYGDWSLDEEECREKAGIAYDEEYPGAEWCDYCVNECGEIIRNILERAHTVYAVEDASGSRVSLAPYAADVAWHRADEYITLDAAREAVAEAIWRLYEVEDRGEEYERKWEALAKLAEELEIDEVLEFDEHAWRIVAEVSI